MADIERKFSPEPERNTKTLVSENRRGDAYMTPHPGAVRGTRDIELLQEALSHPRGGQYGVSGGAKRNNLV